MIRVLMLLTASTLILNLNAQEILFSTDFVTKPEGIAKLSQQATSAGKNATLLETLAGGTAKDTTIDGIKFYIGAIPSAMSISKASSKPKPPENAAAEGASNGRFHIGNSNCYIELPSVKGPCTLTYYTSSSGQKKGRKITVFVNGTEVPEAGIPEMLVDSQVVTRKISYTAAIDGPVVFKINPNGGGVYFYDIEIVKSDAPITGIKKWSIKEPAFSAIQISKITIFNNNNNIIQIYNSMGARVLISDNSTINIQSLVRGAYIVRVNTASKPVTILR